MIEQSLFSEHNLPPDYPTELLLQGIKCKMVTITFYTNNYYIIIIFTTIVDQKTILRKKFYFFLTSA